MGRPQDVFHLFNYAAAEATYGAGTAAGTVWHKTTSPSLFQVTKTEDMDQDEITGHPYTTEGGGDVTENRTSGTYEYKLDVDLTTFFLASLFGNISTSGAGPYTHTITWPGSGVDAPLSWSFIQATNRANVAAGQTQQIFDGVFPNSLEISVEGPGPIPVTVDLMGDGSEADNAAAAPAVDSAVDGNRLLYEHMTQFFFGPLGTENIRGIFRRLTLRCNADVLQLPLPSSGLNVGEIHYGEQAPVLEAELVVKGEKGDTIYDYYTGRTNLIFDLILSDGTNSIQLVCNSTKIAGDAGELESFDGVDHILTLPLRFEYNNTDTTPFTFTCDNNVATYLA